MSSHHDDLSGFSMLELFRVEAETQTAQLTDGLLALEKDPANGQHLESLMRAAHSLKGAARIVNLPLAVKISHAMEDRFVAAQRGETLLGKEEIDLLLRGVDLLKTIAKEGDLGPRPETELQVADLLEKLESLNQDGAKEESFEAISAQPTIEVKATYQESWLNEKTQSSVIRLTADNMNRLLSLAGESLVESRRLTPLSASMQRLKRMQAEFSRSAERFREALEGRAINERAEIQLDEMVQRMRQCGESLSRQLEEIENLDRRTNSLAQRLYNEMLQCRMRPFGEGVRHFPRMVRDLARELGKEVRLEIHGANTPVDRDILEQLDAPLIHLLRNAIDHGCETISSRERAGKPKECLIRLEARHAAGTLLVSVSDDGAGIDLMRLRESVVLKQLATAQVAEKLSEEELMEFLFLPGFSMKPTVTEISGRGVGLDAVQNMVRGVRGSIRVISNLGAGTRFQLHLPITLSVMRALLVEIGGEPFALPLAQIHNALKVSAEKIETLEGRRHFTIGNHRVGIISAHRVLGYAEPESNSESSSIIVLGERSNRYGLLVDRFLGEREIVVQPLDPRLGKIKDISAASTMENGSPLLILDVDDVLRSIEMLVMQGGGAPPHRRMIESPELRTKRILVVDDSLTVRGLERQILADRGFEVDTAVDGMDAWNSIQNANYDLILTDVDMPRMGGIELIRRIRSLPGRDIPVLIVSYKDRDEDKLRGLEAGANFYMTKRGFNGQSLIQTVIDLIGEPNAEKGTKTATT